MKYLITFALIVIASIAVACHYNAHPSIVSQISMAPVVDEIVSIGVNLPAGKTITEHDIQIGNYPILAYQIALNQFVIDIPKRLGHLTQFDAEHEGNLNPSDPMFARLAFGYISHDGKKIRFVPIVAAGVSAIILDIAHMESQQQMGSPSNDWDVHNIYVMADNSRWVSTHVPVSTDFLNQLTASDPHQVIVHPMQK